MQAGDRGGRQGWGWGILDKQNPPNWCQQSGQAPSPGSVVCVGEQGVARGGVGEGETPCLSPHLLVSPQGASSGLWPEQPLG